MTLVRRIARPLLAASFVVDGVEAARAPETRAEAAAPLVHKAAGPLRIPDDPQLVVKANGAAMAVAGALLAFGKLPRLAALVLALTAVPNAYAAHAFWAERDPATKSRKRTAFLRDLGLLGGALLAAVDTEGRPGLAWRSRRAAKDAKRAAKVAGRDAKRAAKHAKAEAKLAVS